MGEGAYFALTEASAAWASGPLSLGTTNDRTAWAMVPTSFQDHRGLRRMGEGASFALGPPRPPLTFALRPPRTPLHGRGGVFCFDRGLCRVGERGLFPLGPPMTLLHGRWGLLRFRTTEASATWARGPPLLWVHRGPRHMGAWASAP